MPPFNLSTTLSSPVCCDDTQFYYLAVGWPSVVASRGA
jgi:hypothetical protein